jgi:hypothetical protein
MMFVYSMKASSQSDADRLLRALREVCPHNTVSVRKTEPVLMPFTEVLVEFEAPADLRQMHRVLARIPHSDLMFQTLLNCDLVKNPLQPSGRRNSFIDPHLP